MKPYKTTGAKKPMAVPGKTTAVPATPGEMMPEVGTPGFPGPAASQGPRGEAQDNERNKDRARIRDSRGKSQEPTPGRPRKG